MSHVESRQSRRVIGRIEKAEQLPDAFLALCAEIGTDLAVFRAHGTVSSVELAVFDLVAGDYVTSFQAEGSFELVNLQGNVSKMGPTPVANAHATIAYLENGQSRVAAGQLRSATSFAVEFVLDTFDDVIVERGMDAETGLPLWTTMMGEDVEDLPVVEKQTDKAPAASAKQTAITKPKAEAPPRKQTRPAVKAPPELATEPKLEVAERPKPASKSEWAAAAAKAKNIVESVEEDLDEEPVDLKPGDILLHPRLGDCRVVKVEDEAAVYIRLPKTRRVSKLALHLVRLELVDERDGANVYKVTPRGG